VDKVDRILFWLVFTTLGLLASTSCPATAGENQLSDKVAVVNGSVITRKDFNREVGRIQRRFLRMGRPLTGSQLAKIKEVVLENLINNELLYQESRKSGIKADETAVNKQLDGLKKQFSSEAEFKRVLNRMNLSEADIKSQLKRGMAIQEFIEKQFGNRIAVSDKEARAYYDSYLDIFKQPEQVRASHIMIKVDPLADESQKTEARERLKMIQERLQRGEDFVVLARKFSQASSGARGGDVGYFTRGQMVKPFEDIAFALKPGEVSGIVKTRFGYHIIKVTDRKPASTTPYQDIKDTIKEYLRQDKVNKETKPFIEKLKGKAKVERYITEGSGND